MSSWFKRMFDFLMDRARPKASLDVFTMDDEVDAPANGSIQSLGTSATMGAQIDLDSLFFRWLLNVESQPTIPRILESSLLDAMDRATKSVAGAANLVPRVPAVIPQLLKSLRNQNVSASDIAREIEHDIVLVAEVIRQANSSYYHPTAPVHSMENAVMLLGQTGLRILIAKVAFRPIVNVQTGYLTKQAAPHIWDHSEKCAIVCRRLAPEQTADPFEAFLAGLLQNVGLIVTLRLIDLNLNGRAVPLTDRFFDAIANYARILSCQIGREWDFPATVIAAIDEQGVIAPDVEKSPLGKTLYRADQLSKLRILANNGKMSEDEVKTTFWLTDSDIECFQELASSEEALSALPSTR